MKIIYSILLLIVLLSCNRNTRTFYYYPDDRNIEEIIVPENISEENNIINHNDIELDIVEIIEFVENSVIMYVTANNGLRIRSMPSLDGEIQGTHLFGKRLVFDTRTSNTETIDNITDYWYKIRFREEWLFGGYLSKEFPADAITLFGWWDNIRNPSHIFMFEPNYEFSIGFKESNFTSQGTWELNDNIITMNMVNYINREHNYEIIESIEYWEVQIIDDNNIVLIFPNNEIRELTRSDYY